jgi:hypothetical protein
MRYFRAICAVGICLLSCAALPAQILTGSITGTVTDSSGAVVPDVKVTTSSPALIGGPRSINSDANGNFKFLELPPGTYSLRFEKQGFQSYEQSNIVLNTGVDVNVSPKLQVGEMTQAVTVEATAATIDTEHVTLQDVATQAKMEDIPTGRSPWAIANTIPSVVAAGSGIGSGPFDVGGSNGMQQVALSSHGSNPSGDQKFVIDGVSVNWPGGGGGSTLMYYDMGMFQEVNYIVGAEPADVSQGGVYMNMVTGDGSNQFHGRVFMNGASQSMQSNNVGPMLNTELLNNLSATTRSLVNLSKVIPGTPITETYDYNGQVGGPLIKDKLWFFTSWRLWATDNLSAAFNLNGTQALNDNQIADEMGKFSYQINQKNRLSLMYFRNQKNRYHRRNQGVFGDNVTTVLQNQPAYDAALRYTMVPNPSWVIDAGFALTAGKTPYRYQNDIAPGAISVYDTSTQTVYNAAQYNYLNPVYRGALDVSAGYFKSGWGGKHNFKFGFQDSQDGYQQRYTANGDLQGQLINGVPTTALLYNTPINIQKNNLEITAFYAMDSWTIKQRLTINYGVRWERYYAWIPAQTSPAGTFVGARNYPEEDGVPNWNNWTPRLGFAYDVTGKQKTVIKGSASRYMQGEGANLWTQVNPLGFSTATVTWNCPPTQYAQCIANGPTLAQLNMGSFSGFTGGLTTHISSPAFCSSQGFPSSECPTLKRPYSWEYSIGVQQQLPLDIVGSVTAWYRATYDQIGRENLDVPFNSYIPVTIKNPLTGGPLTVYNQAPSTKGMQNNILLNSSLLNQYYHGIDFTFQRRMMRHFMFFGGLTYGHVHGPYQGDVNTTLDDLNNPNSDYNRIGYLSNDSPLLFKAGGVLDLWHHITLAPNFQHYTGFPETAQYTVTGPIIAAATGVSSYTLTQNTQNIFVEPPGWQRLPSANLLDLRLSKIFTIKERYKLEPEFDIYNLTNASLVTAVQTSVTAGTATNGTGSVGSLFLNPTAVIPPRLYKVGLRFDF